MSKHKKREADAVDENSILAKERVLQKSTIITLVVITVIIFLGTLAITTYQADNPRAEFSEAINGGILMLTNPLSLLPIRGNIGMGFGLAFIADALYGIMYFNDKMKLHHDIHSLKGSSKWQNPVELSQKYADFVDNRKEK